MKQQKAKEKNLFTQEQMRIDFQKRQQIAQARKDQFDRKKLEQAEQMRQLALQKQAKINRALEQQTAERAKRVAEFQEKERKKAELQALRDQKKQEEFRMTQQTIMAKNEKIQRIRVRNNEMLAVKIQGYKANLNQTELKLERIRQEQAAKLQAKRDRDFHKQMDKEDNIRRIQQIKEMKKRQIMEKIEMDNQRMAQIQAKKQEMMAMKFQLLRELDQQRSAIMDDFEAKKAKNQLDIYAYAKEFNIDIEEIQRQLQRNHGASAMDTGLGSTSGKKGSRFKSAGSPKKSATGNKESAKASAPEKTKATAGGAGGEEPGRN